MAQRFGFKQVYTLPARPLFFEKVFSKGDIESFLTVNILDFSDKAICSLCKENNCILLTNGKDFAAADVDTLSLHPDLEP